jgi:hypothetical protein
MRTILPSATLAILFGAVVTTSLSAQQEQTTIERPIPGPLVPPPFFRSALANGTRSTTGAPGAAYWAQAARYQIEASLDPGTGRVRGTETIEYRNNSPDTLGALVLHLHQNLHAEGVMRNSPQEITGGMTLERVVVGGQPLTPGSLPAGPAYLVQGQILIVRPPSPVPPGGSVELEIDFGFDVPQNSAGRMGHSDREIYFIAYWFPKMAVYDDLRGWDAQPYLSEAEFYDDFADYDVSLTVPSGWTVMATGTLDNPDEVLSTQTRDRMALALEADTIVPIATRADRDAARVTAATSTGLLTYRFSATNVRDFTWAASDTQLWDGSRAVVPDRDGDGAVDYVAIHAFYREDRAPLWREQALYAKHAIEHHSRYTGFAYPWPHMTSVEGADIIGGGMEFPMLTLIGPYVDREPQALYNVTSHELAHMWIPMIVGTNEKRYAWMDEGSTTFLENQGRPEYWPGDPADSIEAQSYLGIARAEMESPMMTHGDYYEPGPGYGIASYPKPATLLVALRGLLGEPTFNRAYQTFIREWAFKHPTPWDLFNTVERVAGRDLDWFWNSWYHETWRLDQAVAGVVEEDGTTYVLVEDRAFAPMPTRLTIELADGTQIEAEVPVTHWLSGATRAEVPVDADVANIVKVTIDAAGVFPDVDRANNVWERARSTS